MARVSRQELADAVGSVREVVARVLREFRLARLVTAPDSVVIFDPAQLRIDEEQTLTAQLTALGYAPADVGTAILSQLHQDHITR